MKNIRSKRFTKLFLAVFTLILALLFTTVCAQAARKKNVWEKSGNYYYYRNEKGKRVKGFQKIGKNYYNFDSSGKQQTGWRKVGKDYRYFAIANGAKGKMLKSQKVNTIKLNKKGIAVVSKNNQKKLDLLITYQKLADTLTNPSQSKKVRMRKCYEYAVKIREHQFGNFQYSKTWDQFYADYALHGLGGDCYTRACAFAYLANAVGVKDVKCISHGTHGWTEINGKVYDPSFEANYPSRSFYGLTYAQLPAWSPRRYVITI